MDEALLAGRGRFVGGDKGNHEINSDDNDIDYKKWRKTTIFGFLC